MFSFILSTALALPQSYSISPIAMVEPENEEVSDDSQEENQDENTKENSEESTSEESTSEESTSEESTNEESTNEESTNEESTNEESTNEESTNEESASEESASEPVEAIQIEIKKEVDTSNENKSKTGTNTDEVNDTSGVIYPVINNGLQEDIAVARTAAATNMDIDSFRSVTIDDIKTKQPQILMGASVNNCVSAHVSMSSLRRRIQKAENKINYFDLEGALGDLNLVSDNLKCLKDDVDYEDIARLYYLKGLILHAQERIPETKEAFALALNYDPALRWDPYFPNDAEPLLEDVKKESLQQKYVPMKIYPQPDEGTLLIDGTDYGEDIYLSEGPHLVQVKDTLSTLIEVDSSQEQTEMVLPKVLPADIFDRLSEEEGREVLNAVLKGIYPDAEVAYISHEGQIWTTNVYVNEWSQLEVPRRLFAPGSSPKFIVSRSLMALGGSIGAVGLSMAAYNYSEARKRSSQSYINNITTYNEYLDEESDYEKIRTQYFTSLGVFLSGFVITSSGYFFGKDEQSARMENQKLMNPNAEKLSGSSEKENAFDDDE